MSDGIEAMDFSPMSYYEQTSLRTMRSTKYLRKMIGRNTRLLLPKTEYLLVRYRNHRGRHQDIESLENLSSFPYIEQC